MHPFTASVVLCFSAAAPVFYAVPHSPPPPPPDPCAQQDVQSKQLEVCPLWSEETGANYPSTHTHIYTCTDFHWYANPRTEASGETCSQKLSTLHPNTQREGLAGPFAQEESACLGFDLDLWGWSPVKKNTRTKLSLRTKGWNWRRLQAEIIWFLFSPPSPVASLTSYFPLSSCSVMYVFGGFNSLLLSDVLAYTSPSCSAFSGPESCRQAWPGILCVWNSTQETCLPWESNAVATEPQQPPASCNTRSCRWRRRRFEFPHWHARLPRETCPRRF